VSFFARLFDQQKMLTKPIPSSGERLPVIGLGSSLPSRRLPNRETSPIS
jgi:hypothetical protein